MKKSFYTIGSIIILLIAGIVFIVAPALVGNGREASGVSFGSYDGKEIRYEQGSDFANIVSQYADMYSQMGYQIDTSTYYYIFSNAFSQTVQQMAFTDAVNKSGWAVPEQAVNRALIPYFSDEDGNYSSRLYHQADPNQVNEMRMQITKSLTASRYYDDVFGSADTVGEVKLFGLKSHAREEAFINAMGENQRLIDMATFSMSGYPDSEKAAYGRNNSQKFVKYDMSVITVNEKRDAESVLKRINNNEITFEDAIGAHSNKVYSNNDGKLSESYHHQLERMVSEASDLATLTALSVGEISGVIQTSNSYSIFHVDAGAAQPDFTDDNVVRDVFNYLNNYEAGVIEDYYMAQAENFVRTAKTTGFDEACEQLNVVKTMLPPFPLNYGNVSVMNTVSSGSVTAAATNEQFLETAFTLKEGDVSNPIVIENNIVVLKYNGIMDAAKNETSSDSAEFGDGATSIITQLASYDSNSASSALMASPKIKDDVMSTFISNFLTGTAN